MNDNHCDCPQCEDEWDTGYDCDSCGGCPRGCGDSFDCVGPLNPKLCPVDWTLESFKKLPPFKCKTGWVIDGAAERDGKCDCRDCEDEEGLWTCETCGACPAQCGIPVTCGVAPKCPEVADDRAFLCNNGWKLPSQWYDDSRCHCPNCEDEPRRSCEQCGGCPQMCGDFFDCIDGFSFRVASFFGFPEDCGTFLCV